MDDIYEVVIFSCYGNIIRFQTDKIDENVNEILNQPWVINYEIKKVKHSEYKVLIKN